MSFQSAQKLADRLIAKNGRMVTLRKPNPEPEYPGEPWRGPGDPTVTEPFPAVFIDYTLKERTLTVVEDGDKKCLVAHLAIGLQPKTGDTVIDGPDEWRVVNVNTLQPGSRDETILYEMQLRA